MVMERKQRTRTLFFLIIFIVVVYTISGFFTVWALEEQNTPSNLIGTSDIPRYENNSWNYTTSEDIKGSASETDDIMKILYTTGGALTFQAFTKLDYIGFALTIFFNIIMMIVWGLLILIGLSFVHDWIPLLS